MEEIDSRPEKDEAGPYKIKKIYKSRTSWIIFGVIIVCCLGLVLAKAYTTNDTVKTTGDNAAASANTSEPIAPRGIHSFETCSQLGYPVREIFPAECELPDGTVFTQRTDIPDTWTEYAHPKSGSSILYPQFWESDEDFRKSNPRFTLVEDFVLSRQYYDEKYIYDAAKDTLVTVDVIDQSKNEPANLTEVPSGLSVPLYKLPIGESSCSNTLLVFRSGEYIVEFESPNACSTENEEFEFNKVQAELERVAELITAHL